MKLSSLLGIAGCLGVVSAQYFSAGWSPGQPAEPESNTESSFAPQPSSEPSSSAPAFNWTNIIKSKSVESFLSRLGINLTEGAKAASYPWDDRIPLVTDENFNDLIVNEELTQDEEAKRMWFLIVTVTATKPDGLSKYLDDIYDEAYNASELEGGIDGVRWGRIDYVNVTFLTTKWAIWQAPYLVFLTDRGKTLRFLRGGHVRLDVNAMKEFIKSGTWKTLDPWSSAYAPGGEREWIMDYFAFVLTKAYNATVKLPSWLLFIISGGIGTAVISLMHKSSTKRAPPAKKIAAQSRHAVEPVKSSPNSSTVPAPAPVSSVQNTRRTSTRHRKAAKK